MKKSELFLKFLKLGFAGWGGAVGRIALMHEELVVKDKWISEKKFGKVLAVYQALPGPEATEIACYFGYSKMGKLGAVLAGLGFMLPGFVLMLLLSYLYVTYGFQAAGVSAILYGIRPVILALILHAIYKIGKENITDKKLFSIAALSSLVFLFTKIDFLLILVAAGLVSFVIYTSRSKIKDVVSEAKSFLILPFLQVYAQLQPANLFLIFLLFFKAGMLTYGGAYSVVAFIQQGAVYDNHWITNAQFLDGLSISAIVPAPTVIIGTFVGYLAGGPMGALLATIGIFLPAFLFTVIGYEKIEWVADNKKLQYFLAGLTAAVVGLVAATWLQLLPLAVVDLPTLLLALAAFYLILKKSNFLLTVFASGILGFIWKLFVLG